MSTSLERQADGTLLVTIPLQSHPNLNNRIYSPNLLEKLPNEWQVGDFSKFVFPLIRRKELSQAYLFDVGPYGGF